MRYLHTMVRVTDVDQSLDFYVNKLGMREVRRHTNEAGRYTLIFLAAPEDEDRASPTRRRSSSSPTIGIRRNTAKGGISVTSPSRSTISTTLAPSCRQPG